MKGNHLKSKTTDKIRSLINWIQEFRYKMVSIKDDAKHVKEDEKAITYRFTNIKKVSVISIAIIIGITILMVGAAALTHHKGYDAHYRANKLGELAGILYDACYQNLSPNVYKEKLEETVRDILRHEGNPTPMKRAILVNQIKDIMIPLCTAASMQAYYGIYNKKVAVERVRMDVESQTQKDQKN